MFYLHSRNPPFQCKTGHKYSKYPLSFRFQLFMVQFDSQPNQTLSQAECSALDQQQQYLGRS